MATKVCAGGNYKLFCGIQYPIPSKKSPNSRLYQKLLTTVLTGTGDEWFSEEDVMTNCKNNCAASHVVSGDKSGLFNHYLEAGGPDRLLGVDNDHSSDDTCASY